MPPGKQSLFAEKRPFIIPNRENEGARRADAFSSVIIRVIRA